MLWVFGLHIHLCLQQMSEDVGFPRNGVTDGCEKCLWYTPVNPHKGRKQELATKLVSDLYSKL